MMQRTTGLLFGLSLLLTLSMTACGNSDTIQTNAGGNGSDATKIVLSDDGITVNGDVASEDSHSFVYVGGEIIYYHDQDTYESGSVYGAGDANDKHTEEEAAKHTAITITEAGTYEISGTLSYGQISVDLGEEAVKDPESVVTLVLDGVDISCDIAPAIIFYNVYECGDTDTKTNGIVDTVAAGANIVIADDSLNYVTGANVAKIYKDGTEEKLHKYDGALYSVRSMNVDGEKENTGKLNITSTTHEGLDSEMHLTLNGGIIHIEAQNDGINTNEDGVSITTINDGELYITAGLGGEGDGIDSNGWLVINGGTIISVANGRSGDGGIDADMGITINGGTVYAFGSRNDDVSEASGQNVMQLTFASVREANSTVSLRDAAGNIIMEYTPDRVFQSVTLSSADLQQDMDYSIYVNDVPQEYTGTLSSWESDMGMMGDNRTDATAMALPEGFAEWLESDTEIPEEIHIWLEDLMTRYESMGDMGTTEDRGNMIPPADFAPATDGSVPQQSPDMTGAVADAGEPSTVFALTDTVCSFSDVTDSISFMAKSA